jgi:hypothetical protein
MSRPADRALAIVLTIPFAHGTAAQDTPATSMTGTWVLNRRESDDAEKKIEEAARTMVEKNRRRDLPLSPEEELEVREELATSISTFLQLAEKLDLRHQAGELHVDDGRGRVRIFYLDGKPHKRQMPTGVSLETVSAPQGRGVAIQQKTDQGSKMFESYALSADGSRLTVTVRLEAKRLKGPLVVRSVYDRES